VVFLGSPVLLQAEVVESTLVLYPPAGQTGLSHPDRPQLACLDDFRFQICQVGIIKLGCRWTASDPPGVAGA
jgi:hypothetical protein